MVYTRVSRKHGAYKPLSSFLSLALFFEVPGDFGARCYIFIDGARAGKAFSGMNIPMCIYRVLKRMEK